MKTKLKSKMMLVGVLAIVSAGVHAEPLDLGGVSTNITDVAELATYDCVTNSVGGDPVTLTFDIESDMEYAGTISGNIKLAKKGVGMLTLSGDNTYTGGTVIGEYDGSTYTVGGRLRANSVSAFGATSGAITVNSDCQQSSMDSNKVTCVAFNVVDGKFAYPINTSEWPTPSAMPSGRGGTMQYNVAVTASRVELSGKITGGGLSVHFGGLDWNENAVEVKDSMTISGEIYCPNGTCQFGSRARSVNISGKVTTLGIYQTAGGSVWPPVWGLSNTGNSIGVIDVGGGVSTSDRSLTASGVNALGGATVYTRNSIDKSASVKISKDQTVESFSMKPSGTYAGGSLGYSAGKHYVRATASATVTMLGTANRTNDWRFVEDSGKAMSLVWNPTGDYTYTCVGQTNTITGSITVSRGTFEIGDSCSFPNVTALSIANGATLKVSSEDVSFSSSAVTIEAEPGATLDIAGDITASTVKVGDRYLSPRDFSAGTYKGLTLSGAGTLSVQSNPGGEDTYTWVGGGEDDNITTVGNWQNSIAPDFESELPYIVFVGGTAAVLDRDVSASGVAFDGVSAFELSAASGYVLSLGAGGISNAPAASASAVTVSAPVMPMFDQIWQMDTNVTFTLSGILKKYGTSTPTITFRQGSYADPTITIVGAATAEGASDFAGDIVFEETALADGKYGVACIGVSGYEPFGPGGTLKIKSQGANHNNSARYAHLYLSNAVISKAVEFGEYYKTIISAEDNTTNAFYGAFTPFKRDTKNGTFPPEFQVGTNAVLRLCGDLDFGTRNNSSTADMTLTSSSSVVAAVPTGKIVFDGQITRIPRLMKRTKPIGLEFNAAENAITNLYLRGSDNTDKAPSVVRFGASYALSNGQASVTFPRSGANSRSVDFDLNGTVQHILGFAPSMSAATCISSSSGPGTLRISQPSDVVFEGYVATNVTIQMEGTATLTFSLATAFKAGSTLAVSNGTVAVSNATALNEDVTLKLMGGTISIPEGQTALVGEAYYLDGNGELKPLYRGTYGPGDSTIGSFFAPGSGSIRVRKGAGRGFIIRVH